MKKRLLTDGVVLSALHMVNDGYVAIFIFISYILMFMAKSYVWVLIAFLVGSLGLFLQEPKKN